MPDFRRADFWWGAALCLLALGVVAESWRMPRDLQGWPAYAGPGVVTGLLALGLFGLALVLLVRALRRPGAALLVSGAELRAYLADPRTRRLGLVLFLSLAYVLALGRGIPYALTTGAYLAVTMGLFRAGPWWLIFPVAAGVTAAVTLVFTRVFLVPLP